MVQVVLFVKVVNIRTFRIVTSHPLLRKGADHCAKTGSIGKHFET